jgi:selenocysteine-specific elongation factor
MRLPSGREIGIVDVPGHARFIRNMLAGVHGLDAVILVVAADEGVRPQTREHLEIVDLLEVQRGVVALTKVDLVDDQWRALVTEEIKTAIEATSLAKAPIIPVSAITGQGLDDLKVALDRVLDDTEARADVGRPRLPIDRVFTMSGFGTVVTGTLADGSIGVGDELELAPTVTRSVEATCWRGRTHCR